MVAIMLVYDPGSLFSGWQVFLLVSTGLALAVYVAMIPGRIAKSRCHPQATAIMVAGIVGGLLTFGLLWFVALIWAFTARSPSLVPKARSRMTCVECGFAFEPPSDLATPHCPKCGRLAVSPTGEKVCCAFCGYGFELSAGLGMLTRCPQCGQPAGARPQAQAAPTVNEPPPQERVCECGKRLRFPPGRTRGRCPACQALVE